MALLQWLLAQLHQCRRHLLQLQLPLFVLAGVPGVLVQERGGCTIHGRQDDRVSGGGFKKGEACPPSHDGKLPAMKFIKRRKSKMRVHQCSGRGCCMPVILHSQLHGASLMPHYMRDSHA